MSKARFCYFILFALAFSCKEPYEIETGFGPTGFLVVDGYINVGSGITTIKLSRTNPINAPLRLIPETGAQIFVEDGQFAFQLTEQPDGVYVSDELGLPLNREYRLRITTANDKTYFSEYVSPVATPPIDSVSWVQDFEGVEIFVSTHDPNNQTHYYQWQYEDVWEVKSPFRSFVKYQNGNFSYRSAEEIRNMETCWRYNSNNLINTASSDKLQNDVISLQPITHFRTASQELAIRYSILVKQHALSKEAYEFYQILAKNNESLGTFFDPQPSQLSGNIHSQHPDEIVVGFVGAYTTEVKRIFIYRKDLISWRYNAYCDEVDLMFSQDDIAQSMQYYIPTEYILEVNDSIPEIVGVSAAIPVCVDCRIEGGTNIKPPFWSIVEDNAVADRINIQD